MSECLLSHVLKVLDLPDGGFSRMSHTIARVTFPLMAVCFCDMEIIFSLGMYGHVSCVKFAYI